MIVYPAIDIRGGRCVRLVEGDFARETTYDADPADAARRWVAAGAEWLHVVDLDGALAGRPVNVDAISAIARAADIPIQLGGGLRSTADVAAVAALGVTRMILGTAAVRDADLVTRLVAGYGDRIAIGLDARDGNLAAAGWLEQTDVRAVDVAGELCAAGVRHVVYTDIRRDGTLAGPNLAALTEIVRIAGERVIASGGIGRPDDVDAVRDLGTSGVIIGRALYDGRVDLAEAIRRARQGALAS